MSSLDAIPKYMRALIFGASRCGLSGLSVTRPPPWNEAASADAIGQRGGGLHHQRSAHAVALGADLLGLVHFLLRVEEGDVSDGVLLGAPGAFTEAISGRSFAISAGFWKLKLEASAKGALATR